MHRLNASFRRVPVWVVWILGLVPGLVTFWWALMGQLGVEPIEALEHRLGALSLQLVILGLAITPMRRIFGLNLVKFRRAVGLLAFTYVASHLAVWLFLDVQIIGQVWADILKRPYVTVGMAAFVLMIPLAVTSNSRSIRMLGPNWRRLHQASYGVAVLGGLHFVMLTKGFQLEPLIYLGVIFLVLALRLPKPRHFTVVR